MLEHVNPYTQRAYKDEPGLAWLALINEGNLANYVNLAKDIPEYRAAWNRWLAERYKDRDGLAAAWGSALKADEDPARGTVTLDGSVHSQDLRGRDLVLFLAQVELDFLARATAFLREELGVRALVTNMNGWTNHATSQRVRSAMDYVDDHFYVDHPRFLEQSWRLPSRCPNTSPVAEGATGGRHLAFTRLFDKPFTVTEYNYSAPGRYRGVGGILTGALGAIQDWDGIWRFAYSHSRDNLFQPGKLDYFNMATDPLGQAAERASICLFLRGDMRAAPHSVSVTMTDADFRRPPAQIPGLAPNWHWAAWLTRVGTQVVDDPARSLPHDLVLPLGWATPAGDSAEAGAVRADDPYQITQEKLVELLRQRGILAANNPTDPGENVFQCETGEITIDGPRDRMTLDTPRTAGGFAPAGDSIRTVHGVQIAVQDTDATVWVSSLDDQPIPGSRRLLVTHLTDLQNTEIRYAERARQTLLDWGRVAAPGPRRQGRGPPATPRSGIIPRVGAVDQRPTAGRSPLPHDRRRTDLHSGRCQPWRSWRRPLLRDRAARRCRVGGRQLGPHAAKPCSARAGRGNGTPSLTVSLRLGTEPAIPDRPRWASGSLPGLGPPSGGPPARHPLPAVPDAPSRSSVYGRAGHDPQRPVRVRPGFLGAALPRSLAALSGQSPGTLHLPALVEDGTWAWLEIGESDLFADPLPKETVASVFANRNRYQVLANYGRNPTQIATAEAFVPVDAPSAPAAKQWSLAPRSLMILRRA